MLTTSHYWFGGLFAVSCTIGALIQPTDTSIKLLQVASKEAISETTDVSYRGSGRLNEVPPTREKNDYQPASYQKRFASHRGSGRIQPSYL